MSQLYKKTKYDISPARRLALLGVLTALALVFGYVEMLVPVPFVSPGVKVGLGNIAILVILYTLGPRRAFVVMLLKVFVSTLLFGNVAMLPFSLAGGLLSFSMMWLCASTRMFSVIGLSIVGSLSHNIGQLIVVAFVYTVQVALASLPILLVSGIIMGLLTGFISKLLLNAMKNYIKPLEKYQPKRMKRDES